MFRLEPILLLLLLLYMLLSYWVIDSLAKESCEDLFWEAIADSVDVKECPADVGASGIWPG